MATTTVDNKVYKGKYGYHPCDHETYVKLKQAHKLLLRAYKDCKKYIRWIRKDPQNRKGEQPKVMKDWVEKGYHKLDSRSYFGLGFRRTNGHRNLYLHVLEQYRSAKKPIDDPRKVYPLYFQYDLDSIIEELKEFYE